MPLGVVIVDIVVRQRAWIAHWHLRLTPFIPSRFADNDPLTFAVTVDKK